MVKKLFKYEFKFYLRIMLPIYAIIVLMGAMGRIVQLFEDSLQSVSWVYNLMFGGSVLILVLGSVAAILGCMVIAVVRFFKNMYGTEGYLTFTLPVSVTSHISVKLLTAVTFEILSVAAIFLSLSLFCAGDVFTEVFKTIEYLLSQIHDLIGWHVILYIIEILIALIISAASGLLLYYLCISIGQLSNKSRIGVAVLAYFVYYIVMQVISVIANIALSVMLEHMSFEWLVDFIENHTAGFFHIIFCDMILLNAIVALVYFLIVRYIAKKKLNLE